MSIETAADPHTMHCLEVWGGNGLIDRHLRMAGLDAWLYSRPFEHDEGGDVYYVSACATGQITRLLVADVSGHGQGVADVARDLHGLMRRHVNQFDQVKLVRRMNESFGQLARRGTFATAIVLTYFGPDGALTVCNAGHPPPLIYRAKSRSWDFLTLHSPDDGPENLPLGILDISDYGIASLTLDAGDLILAYTDSLIEARIGPDQLLGTAGLLQLVSQLRFESPSQIIPLLLGELVRATAYARPADDLTLLLFTPNHTNRRVGFFRKATVPLRMLFKQFGAKPTPTV